MAKLRFCTAELVQTLSPLIKEAPDSYTPATIDSYIRQAEWKVKKMLARAYPQILNSTTWVTPSKTPEQIEYITANMAVALIDWRYALDNANFEPKKHTFLRECHEDIYSIRGYGATPKDVVIPEPLINRTGDVLDRIQILPFLSTEDVDAEISRDIYSAGAIVEGNTFETEGTLRKYGSDGKI